MPLPSGFEWIVILVIALLILGPGKLPDVASAVGKSLREFRKASSDVQDAVKIDTTPLPAGAPQPTGTTDQAAPEPQVQQPVAPVAPAAGAVPPMVVAPEDPAPVPDASPTDVAPKAND